MDREVFKTTDETMVSEFGRVVQLFQQAASRVHFVRLMNEANAKGLNWVQGLEYVIRNRSTQG